MRSTFLVTGTSVMIHKRGRAPRDSSMDWRMVFRCAFFAVGVPTKADSDGLIRCADNTLKCLGVDDSAQHLQATTGQF